MDHERLKQVVIVAGPSIVEYLAGRLGAENFGFSKSRPSARMERDRYLNIGPFMRLH
jgi:hypothetical protein